MGGIVGRLLHEFAVTIVLAIAVLGRRFDHADADAVRRMLQAEAGAGSTTRFYRLEREHLRPRAGALRAHAALEPAAPLRDLRASSCAAWSATVGLFMIMPQDFLPASDTGPGLRPDRSGQRHLVRSDGALSAAGGRDRQRTIPTSRASCRPSAPAARSPAPTAARIFIEPEAAIASAARRPIDDHPANCSRSSPHSRHQRLHAESRR